MRMLDPVPLKVFEYVEDRNSRYPYTSYNFNLIPGIRHVVGYSPQDDPINTDRFDFIYPHPLFKEGQFSLFVPTYKRFSKGFEDSIIVENLAPCKPFKTVLYPDEKEENSLVDILKAPFNNLRLIKDKLDLERGLPIELKKGEQLFYGLDKNFVIFEFEK